MMYYRIYLSLFWVGVSIALQAQPLLQGRVIDAANDAPLSYAAVGFKSAALGTITNAEGYFSLQVPDSLWQDTLTISFLGYTTIETVPSKLVPPRKIRMQEAVTTLNEVIVLSLSPEELIKRAVKKFGSNYASQPFQTTSFYQEELKEDGLVVHRGEGIFRSYYPQYQDTSANQHQLLLYRETAEQDQIQFARKQMDKRKEKEKRKALKKGEEYEDQSEKELIQQGFGGPERILSADIIQQLSDCLDSTQFRHFEYSFAEETSYAGRPLVVIEFSSEKKIDNVWQSGRIFIDQYSDAIVALNIQGDVVIPFAIRSLLFVAGYGVENVRFSANLRYQLHQERWYPEHFRIYITFTPVDRKLFKKNVKAKFTLEQLFHIERLKVNDAQPIPEQNRFDPKEPMAPQVVKDPAIDWSSVNVLSR